VNGSLPQLLDSKRLQAELGVSRAVAEGIMRKLEIVQIEGIRKTFVRRSDVLALIERSTFANDQVPVVRSRMLSRTQTGGHRANGPAPAQEV
jgi:hypothetical protein